MQEHEANPEHSAHDRWRFLHVWLFSTSYQLTSQKIQAFMVCGSVFFAWSTVRPSHARELVVQLLASMVIAIMVYAVLWTIQLATNALFLYSRKDRHINLDSTLEVQDDGVRLQILSIIGRGSSRCACNSAS